MGRVVYVTERLMAAARAMPPLPGASIVCLLSAATLLAIVRGASPAYALPPQVLIVTTAETDPGAQAMLNNLQSDFVAAGAAVTRNSTELSNGTPMNPSLLVGYDVVLVATVYLNADAVDWPVIQQAALDHSSKSFVFYTDGCASCGTNYARVVDILNALSGLGITAGTELSFSASNTLRVASPYAVSFSGHPLFYGDFWRPLLGVPTELILYLNLNDEPTGPTGGAYTMILPQERSAGACAIATLDMSEWAQAGANWLYPQNQGIATGFLASVATLNGSCLKQVLAPPPEVPAPTLSPAALVGLCLVLTFCAFAKLRRRGMQIMVVIVILRAVVAYALPTPAQKCQAGRNLAAGKYAACRQSTEKGLALSGDATKYSNAISKCETRLASAWQRLETAAAAAGVACPDAPLTEADFQSVIDAHSGNIATALAGGGFSSCSGDLATCSQNLSSAQGSLDTCSGDLATRDADLSTCNADLATCNTSVSNTQSSLDGCNSNLGTCGTNLAQSQTNLAACQAIPKGQTVETGQLGCYYSDYTPTLCFFTPDEDGKVQAGLARSYTDNGDGTITDHNTGLMWEKQSRDFGIHDFNSTYTFDGAFGHATALSSAHFAGYSDWRIPNVNELASLVNYNGAIPRVDTPFNTNCAPFCTVLTCSCSQGYNYYWSSTSLAPSPDHAWVVNFYGANAVGIYGHDEVVLHAAKSTTLAVRAVRGGS